MEAEEVYEGGIIRREILGIDFGGLSWICREGVEFWSGKVQYRHRFAGGFGHGGQDIHMISWS
jgi:hypothetical protein